MAALELPLTDILGKNTVNVGISVRLPRMFSFRLKLFMLILLAARWLLRLQFIDPDARYHTPSRADGGRIVKSRLMNLAAHIFPPIGLMVVLSRDVQQEIGPGGYMYVTKVGKVRWSIRRLAAVNG